MPGQDEALQASLTDSLQASLTDSLLLPCVELLLPRREDHPSLVVEGQPQGVEQGGVQLDREKIRNSQFSTFNRQPSTSPHPIVDQMYGQTFIGSTAKSLHPAPAPLPALPHGLEGGALLPLRPLLQQQQLHLLVITPRPSSPPSVTADISGYSSAGGGGATGLAPTGGEGGKA